MKSGKSITAKMETFYEEVQDKRKGLKTRLQTDLGFKQKKIFELNKKYNVKMFSTAIQGGKDFAAEKKLRELKKRIFGLRALERKNLDGKKIRPYEIIKKFVGNMNSRPSTKYKQVPDKVENSVLASEASRKRFEEKKTGSRDLKKKIYQRKKLKLRSMLEVGEEVLVFTSRIKKKDSLGKFCKSSVDNKSYFHRQETFSIEKRQNIDKKYFDCLKSTRTDKIVKFRFQREEIDAISDNFI